MKTPNTNLLVSNKSRKKPLAGDIFAFQLKQLPGKFFFGRVIAVNTNIGGMDGQSILIYIYRASSVSKSEIPVLSPSALLVPPIGTNTLAWTRGFFETVRHGINMPVDLLPVHCFRDFRGRFLDEYGRVLAGPSEPIADYGLSGIGSIDDEISRALGLPPAEE